MTDNEILEVEKDVAALTEHPSLIDSVVCFDSEDREEYLEILSTVSFSSL